MMMKMMMINNRETRTTNTKEEKSQHPPDTRDEVDDTKPKLETTMKALVPSWVAKRPLAREKKQTFSMMFACFVCDVSFFFISLM